MGIILGYALKSVLNRKNTCSSEWNMVKKLPKIISQEEFEKILKKCKKKEVKVAMLLGFEAGLRLSEVVGLKVNGEFKIFPLTKDKINFDGNSIRVFGKGNKERIVPLPKRFNQNCFNMLPLKIPRRTLQDNVTALGKKYLGKNISFHTLRHGFATHCLRKGLNLSEVQMFLGHTRMDTTGIYLHADPQEGIKKYGEVFWKWNIEIVMW